MFKLILLLHMLKCSHELVSCFYETEVPQSNVQIMKPVSVICSSSRTVFLSEGETSSCKTLSEDKGCVIEHGNTILTETSIPERELKSINFTFESMDVKEVNCYKTEEEFKGTHYVCCWNNIYLNSISKHKVGVMLGHCSSDKCDDQSEQSNRPDVCRFEKVFVPFFRYEKRSSVKEGKKILFVNTSQSYHCQSSYCYINSSYVYLPNISGDVNTTVTEIKYVHRSIYEMIPIAIISGIGFMATMLILCHSPKLITVKCPKNGSHLIYSNVKPHYCKETLQERATAYRRVTLRRNISCLIIWIIISGMMLYTGANVCDDYCRWNAVTNDNPKLLDYKYMSEYQHETKKLWFEDISNIARRKPNSCLCGSEYVCTVKNKSDHCIVINRRPVAKFFGNIGKETAQSHYGHYCILNSIGEQHCLKAETPYEDETHKCTLLVNRTFKPEKCHNTMFHYQDGRGELVEIDKELLNKRKCFSTTDEIMWIDSLFLMHKCKEEFLEPVPQYNVVVGCDIEIKISKTEKATKVDMAYSVKRKASLKCEKKPFKIEAGCNFNVEEIEGNTVLVANCSKVHQIWYGMNHKILPCKYNKIPLLAQGQYRYCGISFNITPTRSIACNCSGLKSIHKTTTYRTVIDRSDFGKYFIYIICVKVFILLSLLHNFYSPTNINVVTYGRMPEETNMQQL